MASLEAHLKASQAVREMLEASGSLPLGAVAIDQPRDKSEVDSALDRLNRAISRAAENTGELHQRLAAVLRASDTPAMDYPTAGPGSCELVGRLDSETERLQGVAEALSALLQRLAL